LPALPKNSQLQISNSSPIRYAQLFDIEKRLAEDMTRKKCASFEEFQSSL
jgi:hypothetical protein